MEQELTCPAAPQLCTLSHHTAAPQQPAGIKGRAQGGREALITLFAQLKRQNTHQNNNKKALQRLGCEESAKKEIVEKENRRAMWTW